MMPTITKMFYADVRCAPKISLNVNTIRCLIEEHHDSMSDSECDEWKDTYAEFVTSEMERMIAWRLASFKTVDLHDIFMEAIFKVSQKPSAA